MKTIQTPDFKIYRDTKYRRIETYRRHYSPIVRARAIDTLAKLNYVLGQNKWPESAVEARQYLFRHRVV